MCNVSNRFLIGALIGALVGGFIGYVGVRTGSACPLTCNPVGGVLAGAFIGAVLAEGISGSKPSEYDTEDSAEPEEQ